MNNQYQCSFARIGCLFDLGTTKYLCLGIASTCVAVFSKLYRSDFLVIHCMYVCFILFFFSQGKRQFCRHLC